jgi:hypothetical protein
MLPPELINDIDFVAKFNTEKKQDKQDRNRQDKQDERKNDFFEQFNLTISAYSYSLFNILLILPVTILFILFLLCV